jgi:hypothetical protein
MDTELAWAAGFLEGEGCFQFHHGGIAISAVQTFTREPLDKLSAIFGGNVIPIVPKATRDKGSKIRDYWRWWVYGSGAVMAAFRLYPLMSSRRREQISLALDKILSECSTNGIGRKDSSYNAVVDFVSSLQKVG